MVKKILTIIMVLIYSQQAFSCCQQVFSCCQRVRAKARKAPVASEVASAGAGAGAEASAGAGAGAVVDPRVTVNNNQKQIVASMKGEEGEEVIKWYYNGLGAFVFTQARGGAKIGIKNKANLEILIDAIRATVNDEDLFLKILRRVKKES